MTDEAELVEQVDDNAEVEEGEIAGVPVKWLGEYVLNIRHDYDRIYSEPDHDHEHVDGLREATQRPGSGTAIYSVASARHVADVANLLGEALQQPFALRTTRDAESVVGSLRESIDALASVAEGVGAWLDAAAARGELEGDHQPAKAGLAALAASLRETLPLTSEHAIAVPGDKSPELGMDDLIEGVILELRKRGHEVTQVTVQENATTWEFDGDARHLTVSSEGGWDLFAPTGQPNQFSPTGHRFPYCWYAHPTQIAELVARALESTDDGGED
ncbi:hypothetical protein [Dactylosporangium sp. CA-139066]|uniref:hypothetical protein n=1 Tax=Dactylosporangium sp. CA-139066 TaxID=3239930 RepID=UPI003D8C90A9